MYKDGSHRRKSGPLADSRVGFRKLFLEKKIRPVQYEFNHNDLMFNPEEIPIILLHVITYHRDCVVGSGPANQVAKSGGFDIKITRTSVRVLLLLLLAPHNPTVQM